MTLLVAIVSDIGVFFFEGGFERVFFAVIVVVAVCWFVRVGAKWVAKCVAGWVGPEVFADGRENVWINDVWVVAVGGVKIFFERVIHSIDGGFTGFVTRKSVEV